MSFIKLHWQGVEAYDLVLKKQNELHKLVSQGEEPMVIGCEHPTVITFGKRSNNFDDLLMPLSSLRAQNIEIFTVDRGGHATLHNLGQLVLYPIIPIKKLGIGVRQFVEMLEMTTAILLAEYGLEVGKTNEPGLWVENKKIAAFGIRIEKGVTMHGLALNVFNDLEPFKNIRQCGLTSISTNMELEMAKFMEVGFELNLEDLARRWVQIFEAQLKPLQSINNEVATADLSI
ncbi:MAG: lipoyl(octanoyl) transferase LipB [Oligoflexia bacterium]|nr:lipoyl(octanoyl) transferase LipB [Oligoflexia bacterium]